MEVTKEQVNEFLKGLNSAIDNRLLFFLEDRSKNRQLQTELGLSQSNLIDCLRNLKYTDFVEVIPSNADHIIYVFGIRIEPIDCYIKLDLVQFGGKSICTCHSFHQAERPMSFPFAGGKE